MIRIWIAPEVDIPEVAHTLELMLIDLGYEHARTAHDDEADIVYGPARGRPARPHAIHLVADVEAWERADSRWARPYTVAVPPSSALEAAAPLGIVSRLDIVRAVYHYVSGDVEENDPRTPLGAVRGSTSTLNVQDALASAPVQQLEEVLRRQLEARHGPGSSPWPAGKRWAVWLSHDVDRPFRYGRTAAYSAAASARLLRQRQVRHALLLLGSSAAALRPTSHRRERDPNFRFHEWSDIEQQVGARPTYFVGATNPLSRSGHALDVSYSLRDPLIAASLRTLVAEGREVGLHAGIRPTPDPEVYGRECATIKSIIHVDVLSVRQHYWATHRHRPERNARAMAAAGVRLDSSLGMSDAVGWRRGSALPFEVFDRDSRQATGVWEAVPALMDSATFPSGSERETAWVRVRGLVSSAKQHGGLLVLNWHVESLSGRTHGTAGADGLDLIREIAGDDHAFWVSGSDLVALWTQRRSRLTPAGRLGDAR